MSEDRRSGPGTRVDFGRHSDDYAAHRPGPPASFYDRLETVAPLRGARALDLGTGPGSAGTGSTGRRRSPRSGGCSGRAALNPSWTMAGSTGVFPEEIDEVIRGGLALVEAFCQDHEETFTHDGWRGRMRTCNGVGSGGLDPSGVRRFDEALAGLLSAGYPDPLAVEHRVWCVMARKRPERER